MKAEIIMILVIVAIVGVAAWFGRPTRHDMEGSVWNGSAQAFTYNGHEYLYFTANATHAVVHNPDCKCMRKEVKNGRDQD